MKRVGQLFDAILDRNNLTMAVWKALRGRRDRPEVQQYLRHMDRRLDELATGLREESFPIGRYQQFVLRDPKERIVTAPCFAERVLHHAIMNVCEPHFERWLIDDTFACRKGKGRDAAVARASAFARRFDWFLSLDIRKYFDSVPHDRLKEALARRFKDARLLALFGRIISSYRGELGCGLPIGSLTSQHFANFYLGRHDRFVKETLRIKGYVRYMDDMALWGESRADLAEALRRSDEHLIRELGLSLKPTPFLNRMRQGMDFLGVRVFPTHRRLNRTSRVRFGRRARHLQQEYAEGRLDDHSFQERLTALTAFSRSAGVSACRYRRRLVMSLEVSGRMARPG